MVNADGCNLRYLTNGIDPAISPDGKQVAFTRWSGNCTGSRQPVGHRWQRRAQGRGRQQPKSPIWSSDGKTIILNMQKGGRLQDSQQCFTLPNGRKVCRDLSANPYWNLRTVDVATGGFQDLPGARIRSRRPGIRRRPGAWSFAPRPA